MTVRKSGGRRGVVRRRTRATVAAAIVGWFADRTVRRRWRRLSFAEVLILGLGVVVFGAFLLLLGMQIPWLAVVIAFVLLLFIYRELGA